MVPHKILVFANSILVLLVNTCFEYNYQFWGFSILIFGTSVLEWAIGDMISCDIRHWCYDFNDNILYPLPVMLWCLRFYCWILVLVVNWLLSTKSFITIHFFIVKMMYRYIKSLKWKNRLFFWHQSFLMSIFFWLEKQSNCQHKFNSYFSYLYLRSHFHQFYLFNIM